MRSRWASAVVLVWWTGVDMAFSDQHATYMTNTDFGNAFAFRCMWTNELR